MDSEDILGSQSTRRIKAVYNAKRIRKKICANSMHHRKHVISDGIQQ